jgi:hypothetical protein
MAKRYLSIIPCGWCSVEFRPRSYLSKYCSRTCLAKKRNSMQKGRRYAIYESLVGKQYGRLTVISFSHVSDRKSYWLCRCECGNEKTAQRSNLICGSIVSCGCRVAEIKANIKQYSPTCAVTHGCARTRLGKRTQAYKVWCWMKRRCNSPKSKDYKFYGGRGVTVCERWNKFENFLADMGEPPIGLTLDRVDPYGNYEPKNCRWATWEVQYANRRGAKCQAQ